MENYEVVLEKIVRDLFKSAPLVQIKKYKFTKENEIQVKEENLKNLILEKYPILLKSIFSLEQISSNLTELQDIRVKLGENMSNFKINDYLKNNNIHDLNFLQIIQHYDNDPYLDDYLEDSLEDKLFEISNLLENKQYNELALKLISLSKFLAVNNKHKKLDDKNTFIFYEKIDFILMEFIESIMFKFLNDENSYVDLQAYFFYFFTIFSCVTVYDKLSFSDLFYKINNDQILNRIFDSCFVIEKFIKNDIIDEKLISTIYFTIKLYILKISKSFSSLGRNLQKMVFLLHNTSSLIQFFYSICSYIIEDNKSDYFDIKSTLKNFKIIFCKDILCEKNANNNKTSYSDDNLDNQINHENPDKPFSFFTVFDNFFNILKKEVESNLQINLQQENLTTYFNFFISLLEFISNNNDEFEDSLNVIITKLIADKFQTNETKRKNNSIKQLFNLLYLEVLNNNIEKLVEKEIILTNYINYKTSDAYLNTLEESNIYKFLSELSHENNYSLYYKILIHKTNKIMKDYFKESESFIITNKENKGIEYKDYLDFLSIKYSNRHIVEILQKIEFIECLNIVKGLSKIYLDLQQLQIENEMNILINNLRLENYMKNDTDSRVTVTCSKSLYESISHINKKYNFSIVVHFYVNNNVNASVNDMNKIEEVEESVKHKIINLYINTYKTFLGESEKIYNQNLKFDYLLLNKIQQNNGKYSNPIDNNENNNNTIKNNTNIFSLDELKQKFDGDNDNFDKLETEINELKAFDKDLNSPNQTNQTNQANQINHLKHTKHTKEVRLQNLLNFFTERGNIEFEKEISKIDGFINNFLSHNEKYEEDILETSNKYDIRYGLKNLLIQNPLKDKTKIVKTNTKMSFKLFEARIDENYLSVKENEKLKQSKTNESTNLGKTTSTNSNSSTSNTNQNTKKAAIPETPVASSGLFGFLGNKIKDTGYFGFGGNS